MVDPNLRNRRRAAIVMLFPALPPFASQRRLRRPCFAVPRFGQTGMRFGVVRVKAQAFVKRGDGVIHLPSFSREPSELLATRPLAVHIRAHQAGADLALRGSFGELVLLCQHSSQRQMRIRLLVKLADGFLQGGFGFRQALEVIVDAAQRRPANAVSRGAALGWCSALPVCRHIARPACRGLRERKAARTQKDRVFLQSPARGLRRRHHPSS